MNKNKKPLVVKSELIVMVDVDDTLLKWQGDFSKPAKDRIKLIDPYDKSHVYLLPHKKHVKLLKDYKARHFKVIVWSGAGWKWAQEAIKKLKLTKYVDVILSKPAKYMDDLHAPDILGSRVYLEDK